MGQHSGPTMTAGGSTATVLRTRALGLLVTLVGAVGSAVAYHDLRGARDGGADRVAVCD